MKKMFLLLLLAVLSTQAMQKNTYKNGHLRKELRAYIKDQNKRSEEYARNNRKHETKKRVKLCLANHMPIITLAAISFGIAFAANQAPREVRLY